MALGKLTLSAVRYDNEPALRSLTAVIVPALLPDGNEVVKWSFDDTTVQAFTRAGTSYITDTLGVITTLSSMVFKITTDTYSYQTQPNILPSDPYEKIFTITSFTSPEDIPENVEETAQYKLPYDLFPDIPSPKLYINYENTDHSSLFYRATAGSTFNANVSVVFDPSFLNLTNLLSASEVFSNTVWSSFSINIDRPPVTRTAPDGRQTAVLLQAVSSTPFNVISTLTNIFTANLPDYFLQTNQTYVIPQSGFSTTGNGVSAIFTITVNNSAVTTLSASNGGQFYRPGDTITINPSALGIINTDPTITFDVKSVLNADHVIARPVNPLTPQTYTYSVFAHPSGGGNLYFRGLGLGSVVFDIEEEIAYNNGLWEYASVEAVDPFFIKTAIPTFNVQVNGSINTIVLSGDRFFIGGNFTSCNNINVGYACAVSLTGGPPLTTGITLSGFNDRVNTIAVSGDCLFVGGNFTTYRGAPATYLACLTGTGSLASAGTFTGIPNKEVVLIKPSTPRGIIFVGGLFDTYNGGSKRNGIVAIYPNGAQVPTTVFEIRDRTSTGLSYNNNAGVGTNGVVRAIEFENAGTILFGGTFNSWRGEKNTQNFVRTDSKGNRVTTLGLNPGFNGTVNTIQITPDNTKIYIGGSFTTYNTTNNSPGLIRLSNTGTVKTYPTESGTVVRSLALNSSQTRLYIGGSFLTFNGAPFYRLISLDTVTDALDTTFDTSFGLNNTVNTIFLSSGTTSPGDVAFVGGNFTAYKNQTISPYIVSLNSLGNLRTDTPTITGSSGWKRCTATFTLASTLTSSLFLALGITTATDSETSDATSNDSIFVWGAQLNYQKTGTRTPYISTGNTIRTNNYNTTYLYFNNSSTPTAILPITASNIYTNQFTFNTTKTPLVSSYQVVVSASSTFDSFEGYQNDKWLTPHLYTNSISAVFVSKLLTADFIAFPEYYFTPFGNRTGPVTFGDDYTLTPGPCFYGEGHTEIIKLSASGTGASQYYWTIGTEDLGIYDAVAAGTGLYETSITTALYSYPKIPIQLLVSDGSILSSGPTYYYDDNNGGLSAYPFYYNTKEFASSNTKYRNGIQVASYIPPASSFDSGFTECPDLLPTDDSAKNYTSFLRFVTAGGADTSLDICYGLYDVIWRWTTFNNLSAPVTNPPYGTTPLFTDVATTLTNKPSSWYTTQCLATAILTPPFGITQNTLTSALSGPYPKKWAFEPATNQVSAERTPNTSYGGPLTWVLSTPNWSVQTQISAADPNYNFSLQNLDGGVLPYTASIYNNLPIYLQGSQTVYTVICSEPFDWEIKEYLYTDSENCSIVSRGDFKIYTSNRYVLTGTPILFQNISEGFNNVENIQINLDDGKFATLNGSSLYNNITASYTEIGYKTITSTVNYIQPQNSSRPPVVSTFTDIIKVVGSYDEVDPINYRTSLTPLQLPYPEAPYIASNEWVNEDNINSVFTKFYKNLQYLDSRGRFYKNEPAEFYGWLGKPPVLLGGCPVYTWDNLDCLGGTNSNIVTWEDLQVVSEDFPTITTTGKLSDCCSWDNYICTPEEQNPNKIGKYCISWKWAAITSSVSKIPVTWASTKSSRMYNKKWVFEPCETIDGLLLVGSACDEGVWNVNINKIDLYYDPISNCTNTFGCIYRDIVSNNNILYTALGTEIKVLSSDYSGTHVTSKLLLDDLFAFRDIRGLALDSKNKLYVLDGVLNKVASYTIDFSSPVPFELFISWGGFGTSKSTTGFSKPNDISIDTLDNIWITDTGNGSIKGYSNTGTWLITITDSNLRENSPISVAIDSDNNLHCLTQTGIRIYNQQGTFINSYTFTDIVDATNIPIKIRTNYNKEIIYVVFDNTVLKYFKNGIFAGYLINDKKCATDIQSVFQDEFRNTLIVSGDKILKYVDIMEQASSKGSLPTDYWSLSSLLIHKDEYVQNWVYNKSFQRLWGNIEMFRGSLIFDESVCKKYIPPTYTKDKIIVGQNEIVTSTVINRNIQYLWENFEKLLNYFDPNCS